MPSAAIAGRRLSPSLSVFGA
jgi:membrane fusion protein, epimerase transport system